MFDKKKNACCLVSYMIMYRDCSSIFYSWFHQQQRMNEKTRCHQKKRVLNIKKEEIDQSYPFQLDMNMYKHSRITSTL